MSLFYIAMLLSFFVLLLAFASMTRLYIQARQKNIALVNQLTETETIHQTQQEEISQLKQQLVGTSLVDSLTGLPNRQVFEDRLAVTLLQSTRYHQTCCVMFLDLDHFKIINEALSLEAGDFLLRAVAVRLSNSIRQIDTLSRFSNNEFLFIFPQILKPETAGYIARRLLDDISKPFEIDGQEIYITASIGISVFPADGSDVNTLIKNANVALQQARVQGRNNYQFYRPETQALSRRDLILDMGLRQDNVCQEFVVYYQPEVYTDTQRVISLTAFPYWQHPEFGLLPFEAFSELAEASGRIQNVGDWLIRMVCEQLLIWREQKFFPHTVTIPLSLKQLENQHFVHHLGTMLQEYNLSPEGLAFLITDTTFVIKLDRIEKMLRMIEHLGIRKSIYGFGAGDLSLQYLCRLSINIFRIDASLVHDLMLHRESELIVQAIINLALSFNATVVAEGVETKEQQQMLASMNCRIMQGPLFGFPQPASDILRLVPDIV